MGTLVLFCTLFNIVQDAEVSDTTDGGKSVAAG